MIAFLYRLGVAAYTLGIRLAAYFSPKARAWVAGRQQWAAHLQQWRQQQSPDRPLLWMHCASLGEFEQGRPVLETWRSRHPNHLIVLSFFSPSGYQQQRDYQQADYITYLPPDSPGNAQQWLDILRPNHVLFVKYEFWAFHLRALFQRAIPTYLIAASFRQQQLFFRWYGSFFRKLLQGFTHLFVQQDRDAQLLRQYGITTVTVAGDPRVERVLSIAQQTIDFPRIAAFTQAAPTLIAGSTWPADEDLLLSDLSPWQSSWKLLIAPHDLSKSHLTQLRQQLGATPLLHCFFSDQPTEPQLQQARILVLDTIGMLSRVYHYGTLAYIGGGFGRSIHNTLEPAAHNLPVLFGPKHHKFPEAVTLAAQGGAFVVHNATEFQQRFQALQNVTNLAQAKQTVKQYMQENQGAVQTILAQIEV